MTPDKTKGEDILIVEDSPTQAEKLKYLLEKNDFQVSAAITGREALAMINEHKPSVVISDIVMPEMDGYELCRKIKEDGKLNDIRVILLTALSDSIDVIKGLECGADNFITKPYDEKYLLSRIQYLLENKPVNDEEEKQVGIEIFFEDSKYHITAARKQILNLLISTYETAVWKNIELQKSQDKLKILNEELEKKVEERTFELKNINEQLQKDIAQRKIVEEKYRSIFENAVEGIFQTRLDGRILTVNPAFSRMLGYESPEQFVKEITDIRKIYSDPNQRKEFVKLIQTKGSVLEFETGFLRRDKKNILCSLSAHALQDTEGKFVGIEGMVLDITDRKSSEEALLNSEKELKNAQKIAHVGNWKWNILTNTITASDEVYNIFGISKESFKGSIDEVIKFIHPDDRGILINSIESLIKRKKAMPLEFRIIRPDNSVRIVWPDVGELIEDKHGIPVILTGILQDKTKQKHAELELMQRASMSILGSEVGTALARGGKTLQEILVQCVQAIANNTDAAFARIWTLDNTRNMLELQASAGMYTHIDGRHSRIPVGKYKVGIIAEKRKPFITNDVIGDPLIHDQEWAKKEGIVSFAGYPLIVGDMLVGVLAIFARKPLTDAVLSSFASLTDIIAIGIQRKRAEEFTNRRNRQLLILSGAVKEINTVLEMTVILKNLVASAMEITDSTAGTAGLIMDDKIVFSEYNDNGNLFPINYVFEKGYGVPGHVMETKQPYISDDAENDTYVIQEIRKTLVFSNLANVPIMDRKGKILGCFQIHNTKDHRPFDKLDIEMLQGLAASAAIAIENARMMIEVRKAEEEKKSLSSIVEKSLNEIYMFDSKTLRFTYANHGALKNLGYSMEALRSMTPVDLKPEFDETSFRKLIEPLLNHERNKIIFITENRRYDGSLYPIEVHLQLIEPSGLFLAMIIDITERRRTEKELEFSEEKYRILYETMAQGVVYHDASGNIISANPAAQKILGLSPDHLIGRASIDPAWKSIHEDGSDFPVEKHPAMIALRTRKKVRNVVMGVYNPEMKEYRWILMNAVPLFNYGETKPNQVYTTFMDITGIKEAEDQVRNANEELKAINRIISSTTGVFDVENILDTIIDTVLDESLKITGLEGGTICFVTPEETLQLAAHRATSQETILDLTTNVIKVGDCLCGAAAHDLKPLILPDKDAVNRFATREATRKEDIKYHAAYPLVTSGKCVGVLCLFTRTDKKPDEKKMKLIEMVSPQIALSIQNAQLYRQTKEYMANLENKVAQRTIELQENQAGLLNLIDDVNRAASDLENANKRLLELDRMKSMFIAGTSHELRTPLNSIIGFSSILLEGWSGELTPEQREQVQIVNNSGKHLLSLINDVIDISKIEAGKLEVHASKFTIKEVIDEVVSSLKPDIIGKGLSLHIDAEDIECNTDRKRLLQTLMNLISNAVKFTEKGEIKIIVKSINKELELSVIDSGIGIKKEDIPKLFTAFVRLESPLTAKTSGTGLGLYLAQKLTKEVLGGTINVESEYGKGTIFSVRIPREVKI